MARISDIIEIFIKDLLEEGNSRSIEIQRNELANHFNCAPSQINYVLTTRFSVDKGYLIESKRGGGGYIKIVKMNMDKNTYIHTILTEVGSSLSKMSAMSVIKILRENEFITHRESILMKSVVTDRAINTPIHIKDEVRANLLKNMIISIFNYDGGK